MNLVYTRVHTTHKPFTTRRLFTEPQLFRVKQVPREFDTRFLPFYTTCAIRCTCRPSNKFLAPFPGNFFLFGNFSYTPYSLNNISKSLRRLLQDRTVGSILEEEAQSFDSTSSDSLSSRESTIYLPEASLLDASAGGKIKLKTLEEATELIENMFVSDHAILRDRVHQPTKKSLLELSSQDAVLAQNKLLSKQLEILTETTSKLPTKLSTGQPSQLQVVPFVVVLMNPTIVFLLKNKHKKLVTWEINKGKDTTKEDSQFSSKVPTISKDNGDHTLGGTSNRPPQQGPNIFQRTTKLEETLAQFMQVTMSNHKSIESALKNLEIQVGQLAKQLAEESSNSFGANTEKNPKEKCKVVVTRSRKLVAAEDEDVVSLKDTTVKKKNEVTNAMSQREEKQIMVEEKEIKDQEKEIEVGKEKEKVEKNEEEEKSRSEKEREKRKEKTSDKGTEVPYPVVHSKKDKDRHLARFLDIFRKLEITMPFGEALQQMPLCSKFLKDMLTRKHKYIHQENIIMASRKRKSTASRPQAQYDTRRFQSLEAWNRYTDNILDRKILPERNVKIYHTKFDEFKAELERHNLHKRLTNLQEGSIKVAVVKEFYTNLYSSEDQSPKEVRPEYLLETPIVLEEGETLPSYSRFTRMRIDPQEFVARLCIPGRGFVLNAEGHPWKLLRKDLTTLAQTWSVLSYSNLTPTSHTSDLNMDRARLVYGLVTGMNMNIGALISGQISTIAQSNSSRLGFPSLITALCRARGVTSDSLTNESLSPAINLAYIKKNCWNMDDLTVNFRGARKLLPLLPPLHQLPRTLNALKPCFRSLHVVAPPGSILSAEQFIEKVSWPRTLPFAVREGEVPSAQVPQQVQGASSEATIPGAFDFSGAGVEMRPNEDVLSEPIVAAPPTPVHERQADPPTPIMEMLEDPTTPVLRLSSTPSATPVLHLTDEEDMQDQDTQGTQDQSQEF
ncbi:hypothetical protein HKD37_05G012932 [Glycine soja]